MSEKRTEEGAVAIREHVGVGWDDGRVEALIGRMRARKRRRTVVRSSVGAAGAIALAIAIFAVWPRGEEPRVAPIARHDVERPIDRVIHLADGSTVTPLDEHTQVVVSRVSDAEIFLELRRGGARFDVVPGLACAFRVQAGLVDVSVVGTVFEVRRAGDLADVRVLEGRVRVSWEPDGEVFLSAGESGRFPRETETAAARPAAPPVAVDEPRQRPAPRAPSPANDWVALAQRGEYEQAVGLLEADSRAIETQDLDTLLLASDTMRLTGRPERALAFLDRAERIAQGDQRASLVAFTRGRLLLTGLSRPREAAEAFARARTLSPEGSLAMDALAREVEALSRAGDRDAARARAEEYLERYPNGLRVDAVRRWGGLAASPP